MPAELIAAVLSGVAPWAVVQGDSTAVLTHVPTASVDAVVCDPPAGIAFMGAAWDRDKGGRDAWIAWLAGIMAEARRCTKPGGHALVWALPRTSHWTGMALEQAGWQVRDVITHMQAQGFPKSCSLLKPASEHWILCRAPGPLQPLQIDACRVPTGESTVRAGPQPFSAGGVRRDNGRPAPGHRDVTGSTLGRWPANAVFSHHPACQPAGVRRVRGGTQPGTTRHSALGLMNDDAWQPTETTRTGYADADGCESVSAWACVDGCPIKALDEQAGPRAVSGSARNGCPSTAQPQSIFGGPRPQGRLHDDAGSASRFFPTFAGAPDPEDAVPFRYVPKASRSERQAGCEDLPYERAGVLADDGYVRPADGKAGDTMRTIRGNTHPTVKPTALMSWLVRLVTPPGGIVLDPFAGSGSTGLGCWREGVGFIGVEMSEEYATIARARLAHAQHCTEAENAG